MTSWERKTAKEKAKSIADMREYRRAHPDKVKEWNQRCYAKNADKIRAAARAYHWANRDKKLTKKREWVEKNRDRVRESNNRYCREHPEKYKGYRRKTKIEVLQHYGGSCACCAEATLDFLTIDHVEGGGTKHRESIKRYGAAFYTWLKQNNFPEGFRVLCWNCNCAMRFTGVCPHRQTLEVVA
jgi:hypothetical protein